MKTIEINVPEGKKAEWVNGVLTLVDTKDDRPVTERIKTFEDACNELGEEHKLVTEWRYWEGNCSVDLAAYLKLRIITAALNEGWEPQFTKNEWRYFPWFSLYTEENYNNLSEEDKSRVVYCGHYSAYSNGCVSFAYANYDASDANTYVGSRIAFKTKKLAEYAGKQFIEIWADYVFKPNSKKRGEK